MEAKEEGSLRKKKREDFHRVQNTFSSGSSLKRKKEGDERRRELPFGMKLRGSVLPPPLTRERRAIEAMLQRYISLSK